MSDFGANSWLVDEMEERYRLDPASVPEEWQDYFGADGVPTNGAATTAAKPAAPAPASKPAPAAKAVAKATPKPA
ncbi:MAG: hypothetical protein H0U89_00650, partial [Acidimicrobiia bacterium]|nr:hypothetical protein [Acidimicrobiia bacterium]